MTYGIKLLLHLPDIRNDFLESHKNRILGLFSFLEPTSDYLFTIFIVECTAHDVAYFLAYVRHDLSESSGSSQLYVLRAGAERPLTGNEGCD